MAREPGKLRAPLERIVSGGQTGVDRAALDWAIERGVAHGGWCPRGRLAEDGPLHERYRLAETPSDAYPQRTEWNVRDSDGTVVLSVGPTLTGGSLLTVDLARRLGRPCLHLSRARDGVEAGAAALRAFLAAHAIRVLNVAGPRASGEPEAGAFARDVLDRALA
jgi:hypothetical protein